MKRLLILLCLPISCIFADTETTLSSTEAMDRLMLGNERYVHDALEHPNRNTERREALVCKQSPFAVILGCADSRVSPEILFDQGVGDLFVVRVAGNVIGPLELDSIEYAALYLKSVLILVMGHENCGAVNAVIQNNVKDIESVADLIKPAVKQASKTDPDHLLEASIKINAQRMRDFLVKSPVIKKLIKDNKVDVRAAYYNLESGAVEILSN